MREQVNGFKLDKSHTFSVNMFDEIDRYMRVPDEYEAPEEKHFQPSVRSPSPACMHPVNQLLKRSALPGPRAVLQCHGGTDVCCIKWDASHDDTAAVTQYGDMSGLQYWTVDARLEILQEAAEVPERVASMHACCLQENLWLWMTDKRGRDQFVIRHTDETEVFWNDAARGTPEEVYRRSFWTESFVAWSPHGSYLATMHRQGIALWGGPSFLRLHRFSHPDVRAPPLPLGKIALRGRDVAA